MIFWKPSAASRTPKLFGGRDTKRSHRPGFSRADAIWGGDAYYYTGDAELLPHLYFIISDPAAFPEEILLVSVTKCSAEKRVDAACILRPGEHEFIRMDSFLYYREVWQVTQEKLDALVRSGRLEKRASASSELLHRMREGAKVSRYIREKYVLLLEKQGLISL